MEMGIAKLIFPNAKPSRFAKWAADEDCAGLALGLVFAGRGGADVPDVGACDELDPVLDRLFLVRCYTYTILPNHDNSR